MITVGTTVNVPTITETTFALLTPKEKIADYT